MSCKLRLFGIYIYIYTIHIYIYIYQYIYIHIYNIQGYEANRFGQTKCVPQTSLQTDLLTYKKWFIVLQFAANGGFNETIIFKLKITRTNCHRSGALRQPDKYIDNQTTR